MYLYTFSTVISKNIFLHPETPPSIRVQRPQPLHPDESQRHGAFFSLSCILTTSDMTTCVLVHSDNVRHGYLHPDAYGTVRTLFNVPMSTFLSLDILKTCCVANRRILLPGVPRHGHAVLEVFFTVIYIRKFHRCHDRTNEDSQRPDRTYGSRIAPTPHTRPFDLFVEICDSLFN
jgi:hypothetical protein